MKKTKLLLAAAALMLGGSVWAQTSWSGDVTNGDGLSFTVQEHFNGPTEKSNGAWESWCNNAAAAFDINQSFTDVPDGVYELSSQAMYRASLTYGTATNCVLYATVGETTFSTPLANYGDYTATEDPGVIGKQMTNNNAYTNIVPAVIVEGGNVTIGMKSVGELTYCTNGYWFVFKKSTFTFKDVTSTYHAKLVARATTMLATAPESSAKTTLSDALTTYATANFANVKALQAAINTFLATATVENPLNVTDYITNPSFADDSGNKKNWIQDLGYKQPSDIYQPTGWNMLYSSAKVNNTQYQTYKTQTDNAKDNNCYYVRQRWGDVYAQVSLHQLVKELPSGAYRLTVAVKGGSSVTDPNNLSIKAGNNSNTTTVSDFDKTNYKDYSVLVNKESADTDIDICFAWDQKSGNEQLYYVDDFRLYYLGDPVKAKKAELEELQGTIDASYLDNSTYVNVDGIERANLTTQKTATAAGETVEAYQDVIDATQAAIDAFVVAKTNYDLLAAEVAKATALGMDASSYAANSSSTAASALTSTQNLKVAEYTYVTTNYSYSVSLGEWTSTGTNTSAATFSNEHWSGETHEYKNQNDTGGQGWNASSWEINFSQDVTLPAGNYVFKVAGRQASGDQVTTSLVVTDKSDDSELGIVNDFPRSNNSRGINKDGVTSFDPEDAAGFANSGAGYGWEWRYVKFTLASDATVNIAINSVATDYHQWVSFGDYTLQTDDNKNISLIAYNIALGSAQTVIVDGNYSNVTGDEKTALQAAIDADDDLDKSKKDDIDAAKDLLETRTTAFTGAKSSYDAYVAAKAVVYEDNKPYADAAKFTAIGTAQAAAAATSASDAKEKTTAIISAYRKYLESHALAEGVDDAEQITVNDYRFADVSGCSDKENWKVTESWSLDGQNNGTISFSTDNSLTDGDGNADYNYIRIQKSDNNAGIHQTINLEPGHYMMTVSARCQSGKGAKFEAFAGGVYVSIPQNDNTNGQFGFGWNDVNVEFDVTTTSDVNIGVKSDWGKNIWWTATRFRLVKLQESVTVSEAGYATYASDHALDFTNSDIEAYIAETKGDGTGVNFTQIYKVPAGTGVLLHKAGGATESIPVFNGTGADDVADNVFVRGTGATVATEVGDYYNYILNNKGGNLGFYRANGQTVAANRAYISISKSEAPVKEFISLPGFEDDADGISLTPALSEGEGEIYNLAGQRMNKMQKGINIVNGKKVLF